jgi:hypothetical protein
MVLSKRGRPRLRRFLYLMTMCMVMTNPDIRALHHHNVDVKKLKKMKSIMKLCGKVTRMLIGLAKSSEVYDSTTCMPFQLFQATGSSVPFLSRAKLKVKSCEFMSLSEKTKSFRGSSMIHSSKT